MIHLESKGELTSYLLDNYKSVSEQYDVKKNLNKALDQIKMLTDDLFKYGFLLEIITPEMKVFNYHREEKRNYLLKVEELNSFIKDKSTLSQMAKSEELLTINNLCDLMKVTRPTIYRLIEEGELPSVTILNRKRVKYSDYLYFINNS